MCACVHVCSCLSGMVRMHKETTANEPDESAQPELPCSHIQPINSIEGITAD